MADTFPTQSNMPLAGELQLVNWINGMTGGALFGSGMPATQTIPEMDSAQLQGLMTEWLRGPGNFLENMRQQNLSGLFNTSTRQLVGNDLTAQAALKAIQANLPIKQANAQLINQMALEKMKLAMQQGGGNSPAKTAAAAGMAAAKKALEKKDGEKSDNVFSKLGDWWDEKQVESTFNEKLQDPAFAQALGEAMQAAQPNMSFDPQSPLAAFQMSQPANFSTPGNAFLDSNTQDVNWMDSEFGKWDLGGQSAWDEVNTAGMDTAFPQFDDANFDFADWSSSFDWSSIGVSDWDSSGGGFDF